MAAKSTVEDAIKNNKVAVFSKSYCPYCIKAKKLLESLKVSFAAFELDQLEEGSAMQAYLKEKNGQSTVPNIYINQQHVGGCDDLHAAHRDGRLQKMLEA
ncbi:thioredoxin reductase [Geranomyces variabilis]|uniref:Thioredoxin reductase n=1 Tax=Geranomyces variabilis TaxID=109894 RepID=A0AAD5TMK6_9FUNG|nr:thioredoxin reductase [Geranomyces variabilis]